MSDITMRNYADLVIARILKFNNKSYCIANCPGMLEMTETS